MSQSLANLERKLSEKLIVRSTPIKLTPIGSQLLKHSRYVLESEEGFKLHLEKLKLGHLKSISIASDHLAAKYYSPNLIADFSKILPEARVKFRRMAAREIIYNVRSKLFDIGIGPFQKNMEGFKKIPLLKACLLYTSPSPRDQRGSRMPSSA